MRPLTTLALLLAAAAAQAQPSPAPPPVATPNEAARAFYAAYLGWRNWGIPVVESRNPFVPLVSEGLAADLAAAPPAPGGRDLFTSLPEGAQRADVGRCTKNGDQARCEVTLSRRDPRSGVDFRWRDTVLVRREHGGWVVDDVAYGGRWAGVNLGTLRGSLQALVAAPPPPR